MGAHHVLDHSQPLAPQIKDLNIGAPAFVFSVTQSEQHLADVVKLIAPQGRYGLIDDPKALDVGLLKGKSLSLHWEGMFVRSTFQTADMEAQGDLLNEVSAMIDAGDLASTATEGLSPINAENLKRAHALVEGGRMRGKVVVEGWPAQR